MDAVGERPRSGERRRVRARVEGTVQGVGFRPYAYRLARELGVAGFVLNDARGVVLEVEGSRPAVERFLARLRAEAPPLAAVERVLPEDVAPSGERGFRIVESEHAGEPSAAVVAATAPPATTAWRSSSTPPTGAFRYPFVNCTNCGPRFTIVRGVPYDRPFTTMAGFTMCAACQAEYDDPADRRFHAQPNACPDCGPSLRLVGSDAAGRRIRSARRCARSATGRSWRSRGSAGSTWPAGRADEAAVARLRSRKHREDKPFALMAPSLEAARELVELSSEDEALLCSRERPIVLAPQRRPRAEVAAQVAPRRARARRDAALLAAPSPAAGRLRCAARADERQRVRRADRVPRRGGGRAARGTSPTSSSATTARSTRAPTTRSRAPSRSGARAAHCWCGARAATCRRSCGLPVAAARPAARLRPDAEEHVLPGPRRARLGRPPHRRPRELRDAALVHGRASSTSSACSRSSRPWWLTTSTRSTCPPSTRSSARGWSRSGFSTTTRIWPRAWPSTASAGRPWARSSTARATAPTARSGAASSCSATSRASSATGTSGRVRMPGGEAAIREPWRMACAWLEEAERGAAAGEEPAAWGQVRALARSGVASPTTLERGPPVRRRLGAVRRPHRDQLRGSGGDRARGRVRPGRGAAPTRCRSCSTAGGC